MVLEYLGEVGTQNTLPVSGFFVHTGGTCGGIMNSDYLSEKMLAVIGCGLHGFFVRTFLTQKGMKISFYADNNVAMQGRILYGERIISPHVLCERDDIHFIIAVGNHNIDTVRLQLMVHNINDYTIFFTMPFYSFEEFPALRLEVLNAIEEICFCKKKYNEALPYIGIASGKDGAQLGILNWLLQSTLWSHQTYIWEKDILASKNMNRITEIGPGYGLMSTVLLKRHVESKIHWIIWGEKFETEDKFHDVLQEILKRYNGRITKEFGYVERDEFSISNQDLIIMTEVFEHFVCNPVNTLRKIRKWLVPDGRLLLTTPNWSHLPLYQTWREMPLAETLSIQRYLDLCQCGHTYHYNKEELEDIFTLAGFYIEEYQLSASNNHQFLLRKEI